jgi:hypothetical protein
MASESYQRGGTTPSETAEKSSSNACLHYCGIYFVFIILAFSSSFLSKITLVSLTNSLKYHTWMYQNESIAISEEEQDNWDMQHWDDSVSLYWQLLLIMMVPNGLTFLRCLLFGCLWKTKKTYPWPTWCAVFWVC